MARSAVIAAILALAGTAGGDDAIKGLPEAFGQAGWIKVMDKEDPPQVYLAVFDPGKTPLTGTSAKPYRLLFRDRDRHAEAVRWHARAVRVYGHLGRDGLEDFVIVTRMEEDKRKKD